MEKTQEIPMSTMITPQCFKCGKTGELRMPTEVYFAGIKKYENGAFIQDAFPTLNPQEREQIMTGIHPECWKKMFPK